MSETNKQIFFLGIGGIGMSALARYYKHEGYTVAGYDRTPSDLTRALESFPSLEWDAFCPLALAEQRRINA